MAPATHQYQPDVITRMALSWRSFLVLTVCLTCCRLTSCQVLQSRWEVLTDHHQQMSSSQLTVAVRCKLDCLTQCAQHSHCSLLAFDPADHTCYLLPSLSPSPSIDSHLLVYRRTDAICLTGDAPVVNGAVTWQHTLTSLEGNVSCDANFIRSIDDVTVTCSSTNVWTMVGQCLQHYWTSPPMDRFYQVPMSVGTRWKMCVHATPSIGVKILSANFYDVSNNRPLKVTFIFPQNGNAASIQFFSYADGVFLNTTSITSPPFPLTVLRPFFLEVNTSSLSAMDTYVDGVFYYSYTVSLSVDTIVKVRFFGDMDMQDLDVWCV